MLERHGVSKAYDDAVLLRDFTYVVQPRERLGVIGPNGAGKTTLLEIMAGTLQPDSGSVETGLTVAIGYYDQESRALDDELRVIDYIREVAESIRTADGGVITAGQMLERFLFPPDMQYARIERLSGGERRRLYLLRVLMGAPNVLLLDEPTNDLDIDTLMALEDYLDSFPGTVIVVSHDRYFLDRTADHLFRFEGEGRIREYPGNYSAFLEIRAREAAEAAEQAAEQAAGKRADARATGSAGAAQAPTDRPAKLSFKERKELSSLEGEIARMESEKEEMETRLAAVGSDYLAAQTLAAQHSELEGRLAAAMERWMELAERDAG